MVNVSWKDAKAYCDWANVRLPTEEEWEAAARGPEGYHYPWGNDWDGSKCANSVKPCECKSTMKVGSFPANGYGLFDMAGNVYEWCEHPPLRLGSGGLACRVHGGSWDSQYPDHFPASYRCHFGIDAKYPYLGFRCASGP